MKYLHALWQAILVFFAGIRDARRTDQREQDARQMNEQLELERKKHDQEIADARDADVDKRLDRWMRD